MSSRKSTRVNASESGLEPEAHNRQRPTTTQYLRHPQSHQPKGPMPSPVTQQPMQPYNPYMMAPPQFIQGPMPIYPHHPYPYNQSMVQIPHASPHAHQSTSNNYNPPFLSPQSTVFARYLQSVQLVQNAYPNYTYQQQLHQHHSQPQHPRQKKHGNSTSSFVPIPPNLMPVPRGPPKKPKQSGFAIWVGNLPPNTTLLELCSLFGTPNIQSIFLIERTLCAFVNYISRTALSEGIAAFEQRGSTLRGNQLLVKVKGPSKEAEDEDNDFDDLEDGTVAPNSVPPEIRTASRDRFFICKSLTVEDLLASVRLGIWDTQSHNQAVFNDAFRVSIIVTLLKVCVTNFHADKRKCIPYFLSK